ncbi:S-layer homology domain-containing protein [Peribacillus saganii]|uniref:S-layer homology domain-containing protein n=1 Tax=Peribacillus saganii TaxID=2303992 RepID=UPI001314825A|nr:S-layer homology domain-containing protein [Peribacillus saganii]
MKKRKNRKQFIAASVAVAAVSSVAGHAMAASESTSFTDVTADFNAYKEIQALTSAGIISGYQDGTFRPYAKLTRGQAATLIAGALGLKASPGKNMFTDVNTASVHYEDILAVQQAGIIKGYGDTFKPGEELPREQMASILVRAFQLKEKGTEGLPFKDKNSISPSHKKDVEILFQNGGTKGKLDNTYGPKESVSRVQFALFLYSQLSDRLSQKIESVSDEEVVINGSSYTYSNNLKNLFSAKNKDILQNAQIRFEVSGKEITNISYLEIKASGKPAANGQAEFANNLVLDGAGSVIDGQLKISGNYITIKNLSIKNDLVISKDLQNDFYSEGLVVNGKTVIDGGDSNTVVFKDAKLQDIFVNKEGVRVEPKGNTTVTSMVVTSNANITADNSVVIPVLKVVEDAKQVEINASVKELSLENTENLTINGQGAFENVKVNTSNKLDLQTTGEIKSLQIVKGEDITLKQGTKIGNLVLPAGVEPGKVIQNYETVKQSISNINGHKNTSAANPSSPGSGGSSSGRGSGSGSNQGSSPNPGAPQSETAPPAENSNPVPEIKTNIFEDNKTYPSNYIINPENSAAPFGGTTIGNNAVVQGDVTVQDDIDLRNMTIDGTLFLDPGDDGEVILTNVQAARIEVLSGQKGTIVFNAVEASEVTVKDDNGVKIETDGNSSLGSITLAPVNPNASSEVVLAGNYNETKVIVKKEVTITANEDFHASSIDIQTDNASDQVKLQTASDAQVELPAIHVSSPARIQSLSDNVSVPKIVLNVSSANEKVEISGNLGNPEIGVEKPVALVLESNVGTISAAADVSLSGSKVEAITEIKTIPSAAGNSVKVIGSSQAVEDALKAIKDKSVEQAILELKAILQSPDTVAIERLYKANAFVQTALSLGAEKSDFADQEVNLLDEFEELQASMEEKMAVLEALNQKLKDLPRVDYLPYFKPVSLPILKKAAAEAEAAYQTAVEAGIDPANDANVKNLDRLDGLKAKIDAFEESLDTELSKAIELINALPASSDITVTTMADVKAKLSAANEAIAKARLNGARDADFIHGSASLLTRVGEAANAIKTLELEKQNAAKEAISKINVVPSNPQITVQNLEAVRETVAAARTAVNIAKAKGAADSEISNLSVLIEAEARIKELDDSKQEAITEANAAIAQIPNADTISPSNLKTASQYVDAARLAMEAAREKGAADSDFTDLNRYETAFEKVYSLQQSIQESIERANEAIALVPHPSAITESNLEDAKTKLDAAKSAIQAAKDSGAADSDFDGLDKLGQVEQAISAFGESIAEAVQKANEALASLPDAADITEANVQQIRLLVQDVRALISSAKLKGANDSDFTGLERLARVEEELGNFEAGPDLTTILEQINAEPETVSFDLLTQVVHEYYLNENWLESYQLALVDAVGKKTLTQQDIQLVIKRVDAEKTLSTLNNNPDTVSFRFIETLVEDQFTLETLYEAYLAAIKNVPDNQKPFTKAQVISVVQDVNQQAAQKALEDVNNDLNSITFENLRRINSGYWTNRDLVDEYKQAITSLKQTKTAPLTISDIKAVINRTNDNDDAAREEAALKLANEDPSALTIDMLYDLWIENVYEGYFDLYKSGITDLRKSVALTADNIQRVIDTKNHESVVRKIMSAPSALSIDELETVVGHSIANGKFIAQYQKALAEKVKNDGFLSVGEIRETVSETNKTALFDEINVYSEGVQVEDLQAVYGFSLVDSAWGDQYLDAIQEKAAKEETFTYETLLDLIEQVNEKQSVLALEQINNDPAGFSFETLNNLLKTYLNRGLLEKYRTAIQQKISEINRPLTITELEAVIKEVNSTHDEIRQQEALRFINENPETFTVRDLQDADLYHGYQYGQYIEQFRTAIKAANKQLTYTELEEILDSVVEDMRQQLRTEAVNKINENVNNTTFELLEAAVDGVASVRMNYYHLYLPAIHQLMETSAPINHNDLASIVIEVNKKGALDAINHFTEDITDETLEDALFDQDFDYDYDLFDSYKEAIREEAESLTVERLLEVLNRVNQQAGLSFIVANPGSFEASHLGSVYGWDNIVYDNLQEYRKAVSEKAAAAEAITFDSLLVLVNKVNETVKVSALAEINANPESFAYKLIRKAGIYSYAPEDRIEKYRDAVKLKKQELQDADLTVEQLAQVIEDANQSYQDTVLAEAVKRINTNIDSFTIEDLKVITHIAFKSNIADYRQAIKQARDRVGRDLTTDEIRIAVSNAEGTIRETALNAIKENASGFTFETLQNALGYYKATESRLPLYQQAVTEALADASFNLTVYELVELIRELDRAEVLKKLNANPLTLTQSDLILLLQGNSGEWQYDEPYFQDCLTAIKAELDANHNDLSLERVAEIVTNETAKQAFEELNADLESFEYRLLSLVSRYTSFDNLEEYRSALIAYSTSADLTIEAVNEIISNVNEESILAEIQEEPATFDIYSSLNRLFINEDGLINKSYFDEYRSALVALVSGKQAGESITLVEVRGVILSVNNRAQQEKLDAINDNLGTFTVSDLERLFNNDNRLSHDNIDYYRAAVQKLHTDKDSDLTLEEISQAVDQGNEAALNSLLDAINKNPEGFTAVDLVALTGYEKVNEDNIKYYHAEVKALQTELSQDLTKDEIIQAIDKGNTAAFNDKISFINEHTDQIEGEHLTELFGADIVIYENLGLYKSGIEEAKTSNPLQPLTFDQIKQIIISVNGSNVNNVIDKINTSPDQVTMEELRKLPLGTVEIYDNYHELYISKLESLKADGRNITIEDIKAGIEGLYAELGAKLFKKIQTNPESLDVNDIHDLEFADNYITVAFTRFRLYQILFMEHKENTEAVITLDEVRSIVEEVNLLDHTFYAFALKGSYNSGEQIEIETQSYPNVSNVYFVPAANSNTEQTINSLDTLVDQGKAFEAVNFTSDHNRMFIDTPNLLAGEYVIYVVDHGNLSHRSNKITITKEANTPASAPGGGGTGTVPNTNSETMTGTLNLDRVPSTVSEFGESTITLTDSDLNKNATALDTVTVEVKNSNSETITVTLGESEENPGTFQGKVRLNGTTDDAQDTLFVEYGNTVYVTYTDLTDVSGAEQPIEAKLPINVNINQ